MTRKRKPLACLSVKDSSFHPLIDFDKFDVA